MLKHSHVRKIMDLRNKMQYKPFSHMGKFDRSALEEFKKEKKLDKIKSKSINLLPFAEILYECRKEL